jgi:hypothetical protein
MRHPGRRFRAVHEACSPRTCNDRGMATTLRRRRRRDGVTRDGTTVKTIAGQVPFQHTCVLKIDLDADDWILGPTHDTYEQDVTAACAALTP